MHPTVSFWSWCYLLAKVNSWSAKFAQLGVSSGEVYIAALIAALEMCWLRWDKASRGLLLGYYLLGQYHQRHVCVPEVWLLAAALLQQQINLTIQCQTKTCCTTNPLGVPSRAISFPSSVTKTRASPR